MGLNLSHSFNKTQTTTKPLRIISKTSIKTRITPQYLKFEILKLDDLYHFEAPKIKYQFIYDKVPFKFNDYFEYSPKVSPYITRNLSKNNLVLPRFKNSRIQRSIKYAGVKVWN